MAFSSSNIVIVNVLFDYLILSWFDIKDSSVPRSIALESIDKLNAFPRLSENCRTLFSLSDPIKKLVRFSQPPRRIV